MAADEARPAGGAAQHDDEHDVLEELDEELEVTSAEDDGPRTDPLADDPAETDG